MPIQKPKRIPEGIAEMDFAKLAAFIDGEGHISICRHKRVRRTETEAGFGYKVTVDVCNTDPKLMVWMKRFGVGSVEVRPGAHRNRRIAYRWNVRSREAAELLTRCLPHFVMKRDLAEMAIEFERNLMANTKRGEDGRYVPLDVEIASQRDSWIEKFKAMRQVPQEGVVIQ